MKTTMNQNVLTIETPIKKEVADKAFSELKAFNKDGDQVCCVVVSKDGVAGISRYGLTCNTVVNGNLAVQMVMPMDTTMEDVKRKYGQALVEVGKYIDEVADNAEKEIAAIDAIFGTETASAE